MSTVIITAALTGPIATKDDNPALPTSPEEIAVSAKGAYEAGAAIVHVHLRDAQGRPTAHLDVARRVVEAIGEACPEVIIQLSTGAGLEVPYEDRMKIAEARPAMATLNPCTMTFGTGEFRNPPHQMRTLAARMMELGIKPELEIYDTGHLEMGLALLHEGLLAEPLQVSFVMGVRGGMPADPALLSYLVAHLPSGTNWQVIGVGKANLPMTSIGLAMGGNARTGLEDTLMLEKGRPATSNAELVARLVGVARMLQREPATVAEVVDILKLPSTPGRAG
ncbi:MAG: 3-keto-5-aminohexanoate cleavage protein [Thermoleophilia bacterium]|nr:3-keto-5-aminohexanoate cleavage protein [Thermoleophilia bacterium]